LEGLKPAKEAQVIEIGKRLRELRLAKKLSQGDLEERTGLLRCYLSRVECGHTIPSVETLSKWASALDLELYQIFYAGKGKPSPVKNAKERALTPEERTMLDVFRRVAPRDRKLFMDLARYAAGKMRPKTS
jgi:transcriptional regulator with XRE-family HTH domain